MMALCVLLVSHEKFPKLFTSLLSRVLSHTIRNTINDNITVVQCSALLYQISLDYCLAIIKGFKAPIFLPYIIFRSFWMKNVYVSNNLQLKHEGSFNFFMWLFLVRLNSDNYCLMNPEIVYRTVMLTDTNVKAFKAITFTKSSNIEYTNIWTHDWNWYNRSSNSNKYKCVRRTWRREQYHGRFWSINLGHKC